MENTQNRISGGIKETAPLAAIMFGGMAASRILNTVIKPASGNGTIPSLLVILVALVVSGYSKDPKIRIFMFGAIGYQLLVLLFGKAGLSGLGNIFGLKLNNAPKMQLKPKMYDDRHLMGLACACQDAAKEAELKQLQSGNLNGLGCACENRSILGLGAIPVAQMNAIGASDDLLTLIPNAQWDAIYNSNCAKTTLMTQLSSALSQARSEGKNVTSASVILSNCSGTIDYTEFSNATGGGTTPPSTGPVLPPATIQQTASGKDLSVSLQCDNTGAFFIAIEKGGYSGYNADVVCSVVIKDLNGQLLGQKTFNIGDEIYYHISNKIYDHNAIATFTYKGKSTDYAINQCPSSNQVVNKSVVVSATPTTNPATNTTPKADFSFSVQNCSRYVYFQDNSENAQSYLWDFGDGMKATGATPGQHYFEPSKGNTFMVGLQVKDAKGVTNYVGKQITLPTILPAPTAEFSFVIQPLNTIEFKNNSLNGEIYLWNFGDGKTSNEINPFHSYTQPGSYPVTLTVSNKCGGSKIITKTVDIPVTKPVSNSCNDLVALGMNPAIEKYIDSTTCATILNCPNVTEMIDAINCSFDNVIKISGYTVNKLIVGNCNVSDSPSNRFYLQNPAGGGQYVGLSKAPTLTDIKITGSLQTASMISFEAVGFFNEPDLIWDFGDGITTKGNRIVHTYATGGNYTIKATVNGCKVVTMSKVINVNEPVIITKPAPVNMVLVRNYVLMPNETACPSDPPPVVDKVFTYTPPSPDTTPPIPSPTNSMIDVNFLNTMIDTSKFNPCMNLVCCTTDPILRNRKQNLQNQNS